ncbi:MAG: cryptochrome DASH [Saprospiraceae bacterium]|nr:MAG: cryptochrome DASH [Saprospiraceae bacterium]
MYNRRAIVWFRQDLRVHDNEALIDALKSAREVVPVYVFDNRVFGGKTRFGFPKTDKFRAKFIIESVTALRNELKALGSDLYVRIGEPEQVIFELAHEIKSGWVFCNRERTQEELDVQDNLEKRLWTIGQEIRYSRGKMLYYTADLPFPITHTPDSFTQFRKEVERYVPVREPLPAIEEQFPGLSLTLDFGKIPSLEDFALSDFKPDSRAVLHFRGGEQEALERLRHYLWESREIESYKERKNELMGSNYSSKFSAWLAQGCLSPKMIYHELKRFEADYGANESTYGLFFELLWRDFFRLIGKKYENKIFQKGGIKAEPDPNLKDDFDKLQTWIAGQTGVPFVDANMREISQTGFMSNRGRQNVASFLVNDLKVNWQLGADYFESILIDYDPCSNYGNWNYIARVGTDPKENRYFNILAQAKRYDPDGTYIRLWLPELNRLPREKIHQPDQLSFEEQETFHLKIGNDYPMAIVNTSDWVQ